jgi:predicted nucleotidyltransferase
MDIESLLKSLNAHCVEYVVIGASAFPVHGYSRSTLDIDLFIRPEPANAERVISALREFGYDVTDLTVEDLLSFKILFRQYMLEADIHPFVTGITYEQVWQNRLSDLYGDTPTSFASLDDLIQMKQAANRPKDQDDLKYLLSIKDRRSK